MQHANVTWDVTRRVKGVTTHTHHEMAAQDFRIHSTTILVEEILSSLEPFDVMLMEANGRMVKFFLSETDCTVARVHRFGHKSSLESPIHCFIVFLEDHSPPLSKSLLMLVAAEDQHGTSMS